MKHIMKTAFALALALGGSLSPGSVSARPTYNPGPRPPIGVAEVWYCQYQRPGPDRYNFIVEKAFGDVCDNTYVDAHGVSSLMGQWLAPPGGVI